MGTTDGTWATAEVGTDETGWSFAGPFTVGDGPDVMGMESEGVVPFGEDVST